MNAALLTEIQAIEVEANTAEVVGAHGIAARLRAIAERLRGL